ncbi:MAG TPA: ribbon-helix-helix domain-containing protein [Candidatus Saccharimonadales bacterium]
MQSDTPSQQTGKTKPRRTHKAKAVRIMISLPEGLLAEIDKAAEKDYTSRSDTIRMAILWYLRPQGRDLDQTDPEQIMKTLQHRQTRAGLRKMLKEITP